MKNKCLLNIGRGMYLVVGVIAVIWTLRIATALWGSTVALIAFFLFPAVLPLLPWYMLFAYGNYQLLVFVYGGFFLSMLIAAIAETGRKNKKKPSVSSVNANSEDLYDKARDDVMANQGRTAKEPVTCQS